MKKDIHPEYSPVIFNDLASGTKFLTRSTATSNPTTTTTASKKVSVDFTAPRTLSKPRGRP